MESQARQKIAIITSVHRVDDTRIFWREAVSLSACYDVTVYGIRGPVIQPNPWLRTVVLPGYASRVKRIVSAPRALFQRALEDAPAVIHFHDPELIPEGIRTRRRTRIPVIFDNHENYPEVMSAKHWVPKGLRPVLKRAMQHFERRAARTLDAVITPTESLGSHFRSLRSKVAVVKNYPTVERMFSGESTATKVADVVHLGTVSKERMGAFLDIIDQTLRLRPGTSFKFVGLSAEVRNYVESKRPDLMPAIEMTEWLPPQAVSAELVACRLGVNFHPNTQQFRTAIPVKVLEYMAARLPVVTTPILELTADLPTEASDEHGVFYADHNTGAVAQRLVTLLRLPALKLCELGEQARACVITKLSWESEERKLIQLYNEILTR